MDIRDVFKEAKNRYSMHDVWSMLHISGDIPMPGKNFSSPFREDRNPSCSISPCGKLFTDWSRDQQLDVIDFVREALQCDWLEVRAWFLERLGIDHGEAEPRPQISPANKAIQWPGKLVEGNEETWAAFAEKKKLSYTAVSTAVSAGLLRFLWAEQHRCYAITDNARKAAEIRRCGGGSFTKKSKAFPLSGVDKSWLVGSDLLRQDNHRNRSILICEGATDWLAAWDAYCRYRKDGGTCSYLPVALLGASCKRLHPDLIPWFRGRFVRLWPDGDEAGRVMGQIWERLLTDLGCTVETAQMPEGRDLRDMLSSGELQPQDLFE